MMAAVPLEKQQRLGKNGLKQPVLHPNFSFELCVATYDAPKPDLTQADWAELRERWAFLVADFRELLSLDQAAFWCQAIFEPSVMLGINSYLKAAPRPFDLLGPPDMPAACRDLHDELHRLVFLLLLRLASCRESKTNFITPQVFGEIIYENYIFDITKLLDICCLYGRVNSKLVSKMIENIFKCQPNYKRDLHDWFTIMSKLFNKLRGDCRLRRTSGSPQKLDQAPQRWSGEELRDRLLYTADMMASLDEFFNQVAFLADEAMQSGFELQIAQLFEDLGPHLKGAIKECDFKSDSDRRLCLHALRCFGNRAVSAFRSIVFPVCLAPLVEGDEESSSRVVERFTSCILSTLSCRRFLAALNKKFPFEEDLHLIRQSKNGDHIDDAQLSFIRNAIDSARAEFHPTTSAPAPMPEPAPHPAQVVAEPPGIYADEPGCLAAVVCRDPEPHVFASLVAAVRDILPDLGEAFVQACLREMDFCSERVINAVLEDSLPESLQKLDRSDAEIAPIRFQDFRPRPSVFDGDEFDPASGLPFDMDRVHMGKREAHEPAASKEQRAEIVRKFGSAWEETEEKETEYNNENDLEYNDEYDDTYESNLVVVSNMRDEASYRRPWVVPRALGGSGRVEQEENEEEEEEEKEEEKKRDGAAKEPAGRREAPSGKTYDVRGAPKGRGQSEEVQHNRQFKDRHKARGANHNRRQLAQKKRQKTGFY